MPSSHRRKKQKTNNSNSNSSSGNLTQAEIWDDSALIRSWNDALDEYKFYHSIHARGEDVEEVLRRAELGDESVYEIEQAGRVVQGAEGSVKIAGLEHGGKEEIEEGEVEAEAEDEEGVVVDDELQLALIERRKAAMRKRKCPFALSLCP
jgi:hypothetical protein